MIIASRYQCKSLCFLLKLNNKWHKSIFNLIQKSSQNGKISILKKCASLK